MQEAERTSGTAEHMAKHQDAAQHVGGEQRRHADVAVDGRH